MVNYEIDDTAALIRVHSSSFLLLLLTSEITSEIATEIGSRCTAPAFHSAWASLKASTTFVTWPTAVLQHGASEHVENCTASFLCPGQGGEEGGTVRRQGWLSRGEG